MPPQKAQSAPDFIPYEDPSAAPDFIPADQGEVSPPEQPSIRQNLQHAFDELATPPQFDTHHPISSGVQDFGAGVFGLMSPFVHPAQTLDTAARFLGGSTQQKADVLRPLVHAFEQNPAGTGIAAIPGAASIFAGPGAEAAVEGTGNAMERGGLNFGNIALGARGPKPFRWAANPARGAFEEGVLPAWGKHSAAMKLEKVLPQAGERISNAVMQGGNVPLTDIARSIESPVSEARGVIEGPGGGNRSFEPVDALRASMERRAPGASRPIYGPQAGTPFTSAQAAARVGKIPRFLLPAPMENVPLARMPDVEGTPSRPVVLNQPGRPMRPALPSPRNISEEIPLVTTPEREPLSSPGVFPSERMPQANISGFGTDSRTAGNLGRNYRELGSTTTAVPPRLTREAYLSGSEHPELSGHIPEPQGVLRRFEPGPDSEAAGMGPGQHIGQIPGERGGQGEISGVLRRAMEFPESNEPSGLTDLRHPHATAPDVWRTIQNIDRNTRFNPDPEVEGVNEIRRDIRSGLRGNLEDAVPGLKPLSQRYGDLKSAQEVLTRTMHTDHGISKVAKIPAFPVQSTVGAGLYHGGHALASAAPLARVFTESAPVATLMYALRGEKKRGQ